MSAIHCKREICGSGGVRASYTRSFSCDYCLENTEFMVKKQAPEEKMFANVNELLLQIQVPDHVCYPLQKSNLWVRWGPSELYAFILV